MRDQIIEVTNPMSLFRSFTAMTDRREVISSRDGAFWMQVYPPLCSVQALDGGRQLCPWAMAAELTDIVTDTRRKLLLLNALNNGRKIMRLYDLPANRIMFMEENNTGNITVWVD